MSTSTLRQPETKGVSVSTAEIGTFLGQIVSFNNSLKLYHWHTTGVGSYAKHMALDQAYEAVLEVTDRLIETTYALAGDINIIVPETRSPQDIIKHVSEFYNVVQKAREYFQEAFTQAIIDDYHEALQQLLYRLKRLQ